MPVGPKTRRLAEALRCIRAKLEGWQVRALYLGALASTNARVGPMQLFWHICGGEPTLGADLDDANANMQAFVAVWNELVLDHERGCVRLSPVRVGKQPTVQQLDALIRRRNDEITWFLRGLDACDEDPLQFGPEGESLFKHLAKASSFLDGYEPILAGASASERLEIRETVLQLTTMIETIMQDLLRLGDDIRARAMAEHERMAGRRTDDGAVVQRPVKIERNAPCAPRIAHTTAAIEHTRCAALRLRASRSGHNERSAT